MLVFHAYINEMHGSRSKIPSKKSHPYIYDVKFLALLGLHIYIYMTLVGSELNSNHRIQMLLCNNNEYILQVR
jgi:hypothetical protein